jgi:hypothetical protein
MKNYFAYESVQLIVDQKSLPIDFESQITEISVENLSKSLRNFRNV